MGIRQTLFTPLNKEYNTIHYVPVTEGWGPTGAAPGRSGGMVTTSSWPHGPCQ